MAENRKNDVTREDGKTGLKGERETHASRRRGLRSVSSAAPDAALMLNQLGIASACTIPCRLFASATQHLCILSSR